MRRHQFIVTALLWLAASRAFANTDINNLFDARSAGMGGTGVAYIDSAAAIPINPAALDQIGKMTLTLDGTLIVVQPQAPYIITHPAEGGGTYQNYETLRFGRTVAPLFFVGGAYRVHERVVVGAAIYPMIGMGTITAYRPAPELLPNVKLKNEVEAGLLEVGVPVTVRILDNLSVSAMWRATYMTQSATQAVPGNGVGGLFLDRSGDPLYAKLDVNGWNFGGVQLAVLYKPLPFLRLGLSYRSKVKVEGTGTTTSVNPVDGSPLALDTSTSFTNPHSFRVGAAVTALQDRLLIAADFKYLMYAEAYKSIDTTIVMNGVSMVNRTIANWKDAYSLLLGAEYKLLPILRLRAGYELVTSATRKAYATNSMAPPGFSNAVTIGVGVQVIDQLSIDASAVYIAYETKVDKGTAHNAGPGTFASNTGQFGLSATYRM
jgi:long-subunit fatty acid transport protein